METDFLASGNHHFVPIAQIALLLEAVFPSRGNILCTNPLLRPVATDILFSGNYILSFKNLFFSRKNRFLQFFQTLIRMEAAFWSNEIVFLNESFILANGNGFSVNHRPCAFIRGIFSAGGHHF